MRVHNEKKRDGVRVPYEKKSDGVRVDNIKTGMGREFTMRKRAMG